MADIFVIAFAGKEAVKGTPKGDRTLPDLKADNYMDVIRWKWSLGHGAGEAAAMSVGQKAGGQADVASFSFTKVVDAASPKLLEYCFLGVEFDEVEFHCYRMVAGTTRYFSLWMANGVISEVTPGELLPDGRMLETVKITMTKFKSESIPVDETGKTGQAVSKAYNIRDHNDKY